MAQLDAVANHLIALLSQGGDIEAVLHGADRLLERHERRAAKWTSTRHHEDDGASSRPTSCPLCGASVYGRRLSARLCIECEIAEFSMDRYIARMLANAKQRSGPGGFRLTQRDILDKQTAQRGRCALTGRVLTFTWDPRKTTRHHSPNNCSIDQIVPGGGYYPKNIQQVCTVVNQTKLDMLERDYVQQCTEVASYALKQECAQAAGQTTSPPPQTPCSPPQPPP